MKLLVKKNNVFLLTFLHVNRKLTMTVPVENTAVSLKTHLASVEVIPWHLTDAIKSLRRRNSAQRM